ncbi:SDR family NAD(P)-dependent oxidoreductase [Nocardioides sp.]|uniref:SDR family NAD(P)-dependent oxidoreductase n=1 Tax=Nocardioides sp. TaxID=35761 RepID=UPI0027352180|nr:SDR family NAD(P)-dependent oxidoreductase [Nocardioides sp.]MDP3890729.1 SDR family NAD(P)-dependent oxidoreductase [Nocardioides sp.]
MRTPSLSGRVVAVTGGARGIGDAIARAAAAAGARVAIGDLDASLAATSAASYGAIGVPLDVTSNESFAGFLDKVEAELGPVDALVNNAGIMVIGRMLETDLDKQLRQLDVNLRGVVLGCHVAAPRIAAGGGGQIVNIASLAGRIPIPGSAVYCATKAGVLALSEALDAELAPSGVRVAAILPAFTATRLIDGTIAPPMSRPITPELVAARVVDVLAQHRGTSVVPRRLTFSSGTWAAMPWRAKPRMRRVFGLDDMFTEFDHEARADYDAAT